ncbi:Cytochrome c oxidase assembly protein cox19 [Entomortierella chlamydospora]|uniref:Cytochrome c oxidase assembly protein cox19 n=1 Tax=Entomortierella chlamydospora TaxID=101097 RepID=A0A9P6MYC7_9FUNG|nr:Cytochrome c oxidase assembly protein cox19 [Entomortierella chlamydospora]
MSFGRPPSFTTFSANPPDRGSFPLDHDGECSLFMKDYLACLKANQSNNGKCRDLSKRYLNCRMDKGLMTRDDFRNLGFQDEDDNTENNSHSSSATESAKNSSKEASGLAPSSISPSASSTAKK